MTKKSGKGEPEATSYVPAQGQAALAKLAARLAAIPASEVLRPTVDVEAAAVVALGVSGRVQEPALHARLAALPRAEFSIASADELELLAWAAWFAASEAARIGATRSEAKLPTSLVESATAVEGRMQLCCEYYFSDDAVLGPEVARLRPGTGYRDLASDLLGYARIYRDRHDVVSGDVKHYREGDLAAATSAAEQILRLLGEASGPDGGQANDQLARAWTLLSRTYADVAATALWLLRKDEQAGARFPSLVSASRARPRRKVEEPAPIPPVA